MIAAVAGYAAVAGGLHSHSGATCGYSQSDANFGVFCRRCGVPLIDGGTVRLPHLIGIGRAMDLILTGREVEAVEAERIGLVNWVVDPGAALDEALSVAWMLIGLPQECLRNDRLSVLANEGVETTLAMRQEFRFGLESLASGAAAAGASRFAGALVAVVRPKSSWTTHDPGLPARRPRDRPPRSPRPASSRGGHRGRGEAAAVGQGGRRGSSRRCGPRRRARRPAPRRQRHRRVPRRSGHAIPRSAGIILTSYDDDEALFAAIMAGASGYVLKQIRSTDLAATPSAAVAAGQSLHRPGRHRPGARPHPASPTTHRRRWPG